MIALYDTANGNRLVSLCSDISLVSDVLAAGVAVKDVGDIDGLVWDPATATFVPRMASRTKLSKLEFRSRFTLPELIAIEVAKDTSSDASVRATLRVLTDNVQAADVVDVTDQRATYGIQVLAQMGIIAGARVSEILAPAEDV